LHDSSSLGIDESIKLTAPHPIYDPNL